MKRVSRAQLRGKRLDIDCKNCYTTTNEYGEDDKRVFCYGLYDVENEGIVIFKKCRECGAYVENAKPLKEGW